MNRHEINSIKGENLIGFSENQKLQRARASKITGSFWILVKLKKFENTNKNFPPQKSSFVFIKSLSRLVLKKTPPNSNSKSSGIFDLRDASRFLCVLGKTFIAKLKGLGYKREIPSSEKVTELPTEIKRSRETNKYIACEPVTSCSICCAIRNEILREQLFGVKARKRVNTGNRFSGGFREAFITIARTYWNLAQVRECAYSASWISLAGEWFGSCVTSESSGGAPRTLKDFR